MRKKRIKNVKFLLICRNLAEYDRYYDELVALEEETGVVMSNSPTQVVGYEALNELPKEKHEKPMLSLGKTKSLEELTTWIKDKEGVLSWKLDGLTIVLTYEGGELVKAVTRGNGEVGEVITNNAKVFSNLPLKIKEQGNLIVRGEAVITYSDFEKINAEIPDVENKYKNPRNLCSGSVRQLNNEITAKRHVRFYAFSLVKHDGESTINSREAQFQFLKELGFSLPVLPVPQFPLFLPSMEIEINHSFHTQLEVLWVLHILQILN